MFFHIERLVQLSNESSHVAEALQFLVREACDGRTRNIVLRRGDDAERVVVDDLTDEETKRFVTCWKSNNEWLSDMTVSVSRTHPQTNTRLGIRDMQ